MSAPAGLSKAASNRCFISAKTSAPIRFSARIVQEALVQLTLDPAVRALGLIPSVELSGTPVQPDAIVVCRADGRYYLDVVEARKLHEFDEEGLMRLAFEQLGLPPLTMSPAALRRQPYASNCCLVWNNRHVPVRASDRVCILQALTDDGPMPLGRLAAEARWSHDPVGTILSMACQNLVEIDLALRPLGPETVLRRRFVDGETDG
jgi:hypothetical protein